MSTIEVATGEYPLVRAIHAAVTSRAEPPRPALPSHRRLYLCAIVTGFAAVLVWSTWGWLIGAADAPVPVRIVLAQAGTVLALLTGLMLLTGSALHIIRRSQEAAAAAVVKAVGSKLHEMAASVSRQAETQGELVEQIRALGRHVSVASGGLDQVRDGLDQVGSRLEQVEGRLTVEAVIRRAGGDPDDPGPPGGNGGPVVPFHRGGPPGPRRPA